MPKQAYIQPSRLPVFSWVVTFSAIPVFSQVVYFNVILVVSRVAIPVFSKQAQKHPIQVRKYVTNYLTNYFLLFFFLLKTITDIQNLV